MRSIARLEEQKIVEQHHADCVACTDAELTEAGRRTGHALSERVASCFPSTADHPAEHDLTHRASPLGRHLLNDLEDLAPARHAVAPDAIEIGD
jgi:hypothetical protein